MQKNKLGYYTNRHACYSCTYHLVVVTRYRHPVFRNEDLKDRLLSITRDIFEEQWGCCLRKANTGEDHIHVMFDAPPQVQISKLVNNYKTVTSRLLRKEFADYLKPYYWKPYFWNMSYFLRTVSDVSEDVVLRYIEDQ